MSAQKPPSVSTRTHNQYSFVRMKRYVVNTNLTTGTHYEEFLLRQRIKSCLGSIDVGSPIFTPHKQSSPSLRSPPFPRMRKRPSGSSPLPGQKWAATLKHRMLTLETSDSQGWQTKAGTVNVWKWFHSVHSSSSLFKCKNNNMGKCCICEQEFQKKRKGFKQWKVTTLGESSTLKYVFPAVNKATFEVAENYLCLSCLNTYNRKTVPATRRKKGIKRNLPPNVTPPEEKDKKMSKTMKSTFRHKSSQKSCKENLNNHPIHLLQHYKYEQALRELAIHSKQAKVALLKVARQIMLQRVTTIHNETF